MDAARKLSKALDVDYEVAELLVDAGYRTENRAREADADELQKINGIGPATAAQIRGE
jgi:predicted flap endonuclease-1-like 5' DNA nuclease